MMKNSDNSYFKKHAGRYSLQISKGMHRYTKNTITQWGACLTTLTLAVLIAATLSKPTQAQQVVTVDSGLGKNAGYLIFRWQKAPKFSSQIDENQNLLLVFTQKAARFQIERVQERLKSYIRKLNVVDAQRIKIELQPNVVVSTRQTTENIVVYFQTDADSNKIPGQSARAMRAGVPSKDSPDALDNLLSDSLGQESIENDEDTKITPFRVGVKAEKRKGYERISFAWPTDVLYRAQISSIKNKDGKKQETLIITFNKPMVTTNSVAILKKLNRSLGTPIFTKNAREIRIPLLRKLTIRDFVYGNRVIIDLAAINQQGASITQGESRVTKDSAPSAPRLPAVTVRGGRHRDYTRFIFDYQQPTRYLIERRGQRLAIIFNRANPLDLRTLGFTKRGFFTPARTQRYADRNEFSIPVSQQNKYRHFLSGTRIILDVLHNVLTEKDNLPDIIGVSAPLVQTAPPLPAPLIFNKKGATIGSQKPNSEEIAATRPAPVYQFQLLLPENVSTAFFRRAGFSWFVADRPFTIDTQSGTQGAETILGEIEQFDYEQFTILRFSSAEQLYPAVRQIGLNWWLEFHDTPIPPYYNVDTAVTQDERAQAEFNFLVKQYGKLLRLQDPEIGDDIFVIPLKTVSLGVARARAYPEFQVLESAQGIAIVPLANNIEISQREGRVAVVAPEGLQLNSLDVDRIIAERAPDELIRLPILNFTLWNRPNASISTARERFNSRYLQDISDDHRGFNLNLAGYYLSQGLGQEALGLLNIYAGNFSSNNLTPRLMRAVALLLFERTDEAIEILRAPIFDRLQEAALWRGVAAAQKKQWQLAESYFEQAGNFYELYPNAIKAAVSVWRISSAIENGNTGAASGWLTRADKIPAKDTRRDYINAFNYMRGAIAKKRGNDQRAISIWQGIQKSTQSGYWKIRAALDALVLSRDIEEIPREQIISELGRLNQAWRGDELSFQIKKELGTTYGLNGSFYQQLKLYREAITRSPFLPETAELSKQMVDLFQDLFLLREGVPLQPVEAYLIHEDFKELIPSGEKGVLLTESAVGRISKGSFYKIAAEIAKNAFIDDIATIDKDRLVVKTGLLYLLAGQPQDALEILDSNTPQQVSTYSNDARRLRARAHVELKQNDYAIELLAGDISETADLLRFLIHRNEANWGDAASSLQRLLGPPPREEGAKLSQRKSSFLLYLAATLYLAEETEALGSLARDYAETIQESPLLEVFNFITQANDPTESISVPALIERLQEGEDVNIGFLDIYRQQFLQ